MWVNVSSGYQPNAPNLSLQSNGIFYGTFCRPGYWAWYLTCHPCPPGSYSMLGDTSCQECPTADGYNLAMNSSYFGNYNITQCY